MDVRGWRNIGGSVVTKPSRKECFVREAVGKSFCLSLTSNNGASSNITITSVESISFGRAKGATETTHELLIQQRPASKSIFFYREIHHSAFEYKGLVTVVSIYTVPERPTKFVFHLIHDQSAQDDLTTHQSEIENLPDTERESVIKARVGQGTFRQHLLEMWEGCAVTEVKLPSVLRASHIKPWRFSDNSERLNPYNGLLLLPQYDQLFDKGLISFDDGGNLLRSPALHHLDPTKLGIGLDDKLRRLEDGHLGFLQYHRSEVFVEFNE